VALDRGEVLQAGLRIGTSPVRAAAISKWIACPEILALRVSLDVGLRVVPEAGFAR
jgi:hypothetical protein